MKPILDVKPKDLKPKAPKPPSKFEGKGTKARLETAARKMMFNYQAKGR